LDGKATSKLSPWLAHGCLSPRLVHEEVERYMAAYKASTATSRETATYGYVHRVVRELMWRDFTRFGSIEAGTSIFKVGGRNKTIKWKQPAPAKKEATKKEDGWNWPLNEKLLQVWMDGTTGFPFVDSFMRELKSTGYCKHIGRLCAGWFLVSDLGLDWRMGGEWFESVLIDFEPCLNWFNWVYACLEPVDFKKPPAGQQQVLEILEAGIQHDPEALYLKRWLPELAALPSVLAREPWRLDPKGITWAPKHTSLRKRMSFIRTSPLKQEHRERAELAANAADASKCCYDRSAIQRGIAAACLPCFAGFFTSSPKRAPETYNFRYGVDYPKPIIQPVSLMHAEAAEAKTLVARAYTKVEKEEELALLAKSAPRLAVGA